MALNEASKVARGMVFWYDPICAYKVDGAKSGGGAYERAPGVQEQATPGCK